MSFKLFLLSTFKGLKNTDKTENEKDALFADYQEYTELRNSADLKLYLDLQQFINTDAFKKERAQTKSLKFSGSRESKLIRKFKKLDASPKIKDFYVTQGSADLQKYQQLEDSDLIKEFIGLRDYVQSKKYRADKKAFKPNGNESFEDTDACKKFGRYQELSKMNDVLFWTEFPNQKMYKNYQKMLNSPQRDHYEELKKEISSEAFIARKEFLEDPDRWEKTEASQKEKAYQELKVQPRFMTYEKYRKSNDAFSFFENYELILQDNFDEGKLDETKWQPITPLAESTVGRNFSKAGDLQAYTNGENILQSGSLLKLTVKKEQTDSLLWDFPVGFSPVSFSYSSGILCSKQSFLVQHGVLEAKIKYQPDKQLVDLCCLTDDQNKFRLNLLEAGTVCRFGFSQENGGTYEPLGSLSAGQFYIFSVAWGQGEIRWKINDHVIYTTQQSLPDVPLRINMSSIVVEPPRQLPHQFEVDWIRLYRKR
jgi:beta-glucanase (GH16 family)